MEENLEIEDIREQPLEMKVQSTDEEFIEFQEIVKDDTEMKEGSLGKFKDVDALIFAYNNLQAEFTRKCQKLSETEKAYKQVLENLEPKSDKTVLNPEDDSGDINKLDVDIQNDNSNLNNEPITANQIENSISSTPLNFSKDLSQADYEALFKDKSFVENFLNANKQLQDEIVIQYLEELMKNKAPKLMTTSQGSGISPLQPPKPQTLGEAKLLIADMFKN